MTTTVATLSDAVMARLGTLSSQVAVYDGQVPKGPGSVYATFYPNLGVVTSDRHGGGYRAFAWGFFVICVGRQPREAVTAADLVRGVFLGWRPDPSESASPLEEVDLGSSLQRDESVPTDIRYSLTLRFTLTTTRS